MPKKKLSLLLKKKAPKKHFLRNKIIGVSFFLLALLIIVVPQYLPKPKPNNKSPITISSELLTLSKTQDNPLRIIIPKVNIDLPVVDAKVINGFWEISETSASYGLGSGLPGTKSNTVIFAHAREGLFYNLKDVKLNDIIYVFTKNKWYRYKVNKITAVYPEEVDVIRPTKTQVLTLYTCTGFADTKRLIIQAIPQN